MESVYPLPSLSRLSSSLFSSQSAVLLNPPPSASLRRLFPSSFEFCELKHLHYLIILYLLIRDVLQIYSRGCGSGGNGGCADNYFDSGIGCQQQDPQHSQQLATLFHSPPILPLPLPLYPSHSITLIPIPSPSISIKTTKKNMLTHNLRSTSISTGALRLPSKSQPNHHPRTIQRCVQQVFEYEWRHGRE